LFDFIGLLLKNLGTCFQSVSPASSDISIFGPSFPS
jgi:hypothetical protein